MDTGHSKFFLPKKHCDDYLEVREINNKGLVYLGFGFTSWYDFRRKEIEKGEREKEKNEETFINKVKEKELVGYQSVVWKDESSLFYYWITCGSVIFT